VISARCPTNTRWAGRDDAVGSDVDGSGAAGAGVAGAGVAGSGVIWASKMDMHLPPVAGIGAVGIGVVAALPFIGRAPLKNARAHRSLPAIWRHGRAISRHMSDM